MCFYERLRETRKQKNISQKEIARKIGVAASTYCQYEKGTREPDLIKLKLLSKALNVSPDYLIFGKIAHEKTKTPYDLLNEAGQFKVQEYIMDLLENPKYVRQFENASDKPGEK